MRLRALLTGITALGLAASGNLVSSAGAAEDIPRPAKDPFYRYDGTTPLREIDPGTPLKTRSVTLAADTNQTPLPAEQILYRTTDATGHPIATVTTVVLPTTGTAAPRLVGYLSFYDALSSKCNPSYTLRGGDPGPENERLTDVEQGLVQALHAQGYIVTVPDFEGPHLDFVAGTVAGRSTLDGVRATLATLELDSSTPVGLVGYSGGSIAADWASELAPRYAPELDLVGTAMGGVPANLRHNLRYIDGSPEWSSVIPAAMIGISRAYDVRLRPYLSRWGRMVVRTERHQCIGEFNGEFPGLTVKRLMKRRYEDLNRVPVFDRLLDKLTMGTAKGHPEVPFLIAWGKSDDTGDDVMVAADQQALADRYCRNGLPVQTMEFEGASHTDAAVGFFDAAFPWLASRFAGSPPPDTCT